MFDPLPTDVEYPPQYTTSAHLRLSWAERLPEPDAEPDAAAAAEAAAMTSPPITPTSPSFHRRQSSSFSADHSPNSRRHSQGLSLSRRSSNAYSPATSRLGSSHGHVGGGDSLAQEFAEMDDAGGLGSLADELGGWSGEEEEELDEDEDEEEFEGEEGAGRGEGEQERDSGIDVASSPPPGIASSKLLNPLSIVTRSGKNLNKRFNSAYDGSEYGSESELEQTELVSATLEARLSVVEALARRGMEENGSEGDRVVARVTEGLQDLGGQSGIESGVTRLTTSYTALSTHLTHQTRLLSSLSSTLFSPLAPPLPLDLIHDLLPNLDSALELLPTITPTPSAPYALHSLVTHTADLVQSLNYLSDTLHVNRQSTNVAGRRLRAVKEALREWRGEMDRRDESVRWIEKGGWEERLRGRECKGVCDEVLGGFEDVCGAWRERLVGGLPEVDVVAA